MKLLENGIWGIIIRTRHQEGMKAVESQEHQEARSQRPPGLSFISYLLSALQTGYINLAGKMANSFIIFSSSC